MFKTCSVRLLFGAVSTKPSFYWEQCLGDLPRTSQLMIQGPSASESLGRRGYLLKIPTLGPLSTFVNSVSGTGMAKIIFNKHSC